MTRFLLAVDTVHAAAAACDYLADRLDEGDAVTVLSARAPGAAGRDAGDAANVVRVRLGDLVPVEPVVRAGEPAEVVLELASGDVDEVVIGARAGAADGGPGPGRTAQAVLEGADVPVVVLPTPGF